MFFTIISAAGLIGAGIHLAVSSKTVTKGRFVEIFLLYILVFCVGVNGVLAGMGHIFNADLIAMQIGWPTGSPFQFEVGMHDFAWGVLGLLCLRFKDNFRTATGLGWSLFLIGAGYGHIRDAAEYGNFSPYNFGMILPDFVVPAVILPLLWLNHRWNGTHAHHHGG